MANSSEQLFLDDLSIFLAVCETGGFRAAAKRLAMSPSSVSEKIAQLEARLGVPLLIRTTRSVMPTEAGRGLAARITPLLSETRAALNDAASTHGQVRGLLRLNVTGAVMVDILPPLIDRFLDLNPHVRVEMVVEDRLVDATAAGCDAGIRYGEHLAQDMIAVPIGPRIQRLAAAASPDYLEARGNPGIPAICSITTASASGFPAGARRVGVPEGRGNRHRRSAGSVDRRGRGCRNRDRLGLPWPWFYCDIREFHRSLPQVRRSGAGAA